MSTLYIVATPIGNLEDMTFRAVRTLKEVDLILCENTSNAQRLLKHYEINTKTSVYFSKSKLSHSEKIFKLFEEGKSVALISDAGTPAISDPGALLIKEVRKRFGVEFCPPFGGTENLRNISKGNVSKFSGGSVLEDEKVRIVPVPGASAITALFSVSGVFGNEFLFLGFVPQKKGRETFIKNIFEEIKVRPVVFYESVHRVMKLFESLAKFEDGLVSPSGGQLAQRAGGAKIIIGRELTKMHEEIFSGSFSEALEYFKNNPDHLRGEFVIIIESKK